MKRQAGFNLIELMIAVAIVGTIAAVAYPSYREQIRATNRADCAGAMIGLAGSMERFHTVNGTYLGAGAAGGNTGTPTIFPGACPVDGNTPTYNLTIQAATASTYTLNAAPTGSQAGDKCGTLTLNNRGLKGVSGPASGTTWQDCW